jgi:hypothetical protein
VDNAERVRAVDGVEYRPGPLGDFVEGAPIRRRQDLVQAEQRPERDACAVNIPSASQRGNSKSAGGTNRAAALCMSAAARPRLCTAAASIPSSVSSTSPATHVDTSQ